ncbi:peptidyl-tRNA hydrolase [Mycobacteroides abscessus]|nr:peptidyl-tRNA hydrolase [Mycobacteroides abscessus]
MTRATDVERRSLPDGVLGMLPGPSTTTLRGRTSTSATTSWATCCSIRRTSSGEQGADAAELLIRLGLEAAQNQVHAWG